MNESEKNRFKGLNLMVVLLVNLLLAGGCTEVIDLDLKSVNHRLVVEGVVTNEMKFHFVRLTKSIPYFENKPAPQVLGATVTLSDGISVFRMQEAFDFPGVYFSLDKFIGIPGRTYSLEIKNVDINGDGVPEQYEASCVMPEVGRADSIELQYSQEWEIWKILLYGQDPPQTKDYYLFRVFKNGNLISGSISEYSIVSDKFFDGNYARGMWVQSLDAGNESRPLQEGDIITLQMAGITHEFYNFIEAVQRENRGKYPLFSGPPANVPGNVSNGALGFFSASAVTYRSKRVEK